MLAMVNAAPVQDEQKNDLQSLLNALTDQKTGKDLTPNEQQVFNDESEADTESYKNLARLLSSLVANEQQYDDGNQAKAQFFRFWANKQSDDKDVANAQFWRFMAKTLVRRLASHAIRKLG